VSGWRAGDLAYCTAANRARGLLECGRVYNVSRVIPVPAHVGCGLVLAETAPPAPMEGFWSNRFIRLERGHSLLRQIDAAHRPTN